MLMKSLIPVLMVCGGLLTLGFSAQAGVLQRSVIPADAVWWLHLDLAQAKNTELGRFVLGQLEQPEAQAKFAAFQAIFNFDPRHTLTGCTLYGRSQSPKDAVLLLQGGFDTERLATLARAGQDYQSHSHRLYEVHSWIDRNRPAQAGIQPRSYGAIHPGGLVVLGQNAQRLGEALDVIDGFIPSLETSDAFRQWAGPTDTAFLLAAARRVDGLTSDPRAAFLRHCAQVSMATGETGDVLFAETSLVMNDEPTAQSVFAIVQGLKALTSLRTDDPNAVKLAQATSLAQDGAQVSIKLRLASAEVVQALRQAASRIGQR
jgi:hypothetical protein